MKPWKLMIVMLSIAALTGGCLTDDGDDDDKNNPSNISELTTGGYAFVIGGGGYGIAQVVTLKGDNVYDDAAVYVNGIKLQNNLGIHTNAQPLPLDRLTATGSVRFAVYAFGDSIVATVPIPQAPVIEEPINNAVLAVGAKMPFIIGFPGAHDYIAFTIMGQGVRYGLETDKTQLSGEIPGTSLANAGAQQLTAYSANVSGDIPDDFDLTNPQKLFVAASVAIHNLTFMAQQ